MPTPATRHGRREPRGAPRRGIVMLYTSGGLAAIVLLGLAATIVLRDTSTTVSIRAAQEQSKVMAIGVVEPALSDDAAAGSAAFVARFDGIVRQRLLPTGVVRVKLWTAGGRIVYSDEPRLIGRTFPLHAGEHRVLRDGGSDADVSDLTSPENRFETRGRKLLEVYRRVETPASVPLLFETYFPYTNVTAERDALWRRYAPVVIGTLAALAVVQLALAWSLARRIRREQRERERLHEQTLRASAEERERIARDLHDGVVQDLAGVSYTLAGAIDELGPDIDPASRAALDDASAATRRGISQLRTLLVDIYPPNLATEGLEAALRDLLTRAQTDGLATDLEYEDGVQLTGMDQELAFRVAQEAIRNTLRHAHASRIAVRVTRTETGATLEVSDDGRGFDPATVTANGHFGLRYLRDVGTRAGARVDVASAPGQGTTVRLSWRRS
ncbi:MAG: sensor histidine kinase [Acidimicrobiia bacterium]